MNFKFVFLTHRQVKFINHYQLTGRGAESARKAGYPPHSAKWRAYELLHHGRVKQTLDQLNRLKKVEKSNPTR